MLASVLRYTVRGLSFRGVTLALGLVSMVRALR